MFQKSPRPTATPLLKRGAKTLRFGLILCLSVLMLHGCGFHLRGSYEIPQGLKYLQLSPEQPYDPLQRILRKMLVSHGVHLSAGADTDASQPKPSILTIQNQSFEERPIAYGMDGQATRLRLELRLAYAVDLQPGNHRHTNTIRVQREWMVDPRNVLASDNERQRLKEDLFEEAAAQCISALSLYKVL